MTHTHTHNPSITHNPPPSLTINPTPNPNCVTPFLCSTRTPRGRIGGNALGGNARRPNTAAAPRARSCTGLLPIPLPLPLPAEPSTAQYSDCQLDSMVV